MTTDTFTWHLPGRQLSLEVSGSQMFKQQASGPQVVRGTWLVRGYLPWPCWSPTSPAQSAARPQTGAPAHIALILTYASSGPTL